MRLYDVAAEIEAVLLAGVDQETGEISDEALRQIEELELERDRKALDLAAWVKGQEAEAEAIRQECERLSRRASVLTRRAERVRELLERVVPVGTKLSDPRAALSWRKSEAVEIRDERKLVEAWEQRELPAEVAGYKLIVSKLAVKALLRAGQAVPGAELVQRHNLQIK